MASLFDSLYSHKDNCFETNGFDLLESHLKGAKELGLKSYIGKIEKSMIERLILQTITQTECAKILKMSQPALNAKLKHYGINTINK